MILGLQIIALVFTLIMVYFAYVHYRKGDINGIEMLFWLIAWVGAALIIIFPEVFTAFARTIAITRSFDLAVIGGFILIIPLVYMSYVRTRKLEKKLEELVRNEALKGVETKKSK